MRRIVRSRNAEADRVVGSAQRIVVIGLLILGPPLWRRIEPLDYRTVMSYEAAINIALWIAWFTYWVVAARSAAKGTSSEKRSSRLVQLMAALTSLALLVLRPVHVGLPGGRLVDIAGDVVTALGLAFAIWARRHLGSYWSGRVELKADHRVIRSGPYSLVRHPIYTGILVGILGSAIVAREVTAFGAVFVMLVAYLRKIRMEEAVLLKTFGAEYESYRREVKALVPRVV